MASNRLNSWRKCSHFEDLVIRLHLLRMPHNELPHFLADICIKKLTKRQNFEAHLLSYRQILALIHRNCCHLFRLQKHISKWFSYPLVNMGAGYILLPIYAYPTQKRQRAKKSMSLQRRRKRKPNRAHAISAQIENFISLFLLIFM